MTERQRKMARHALGLPNQARQSYRNRFIAKMGHADWEDWQAMVAAGHADYDSAVATFSLTLPGAWEALDPKEKLDREDFPTGKRA
jgi:hypothetical protein